MKIKDDIYYVGVQDRTKHRFEGLWFLPKGVSYNSYLIVDEKVALIDGVEADFFPQFIDNLHEVLGDRPIDYLIINHMEPDHSGALHMLRKFYPNIRLVGNKKTFDMVEGFYGEDTSKDVCVTGGDTLKLGRHELQFELVPMLHWPETMVSYDKTDKILFSGDAFGCFGALNGGVLDTQMHTDDFFSEMERYYAAILGKYGAQVQQALKKLAPLDIQWICSTHGPVWTGKDAAKAIETYDRLSSGRTEEGIVVCYGSMYGNSQRVAEALAEGAMEAGMEKVIVHNLSVSQPSFVLADIFRYRGLAIGGPTYNASVFPPVKDLLERLSCRDVRHHDLAIFGGYTWASAAVKTIASYEDKLKMNRIGEALEWKQGAHPETLEQARELGRQLAKAVHFYFAQ